MTENVDKLHKMWRERLAEVAEIETTDPVLERKGKMLALYIALLFVFLIYSLFNSLYILVVYKYPQYNLYIAEIVVSFLPVYIFWKLNQKGRVMLAAYLSITYSILGSALGSDPKFMEYMMVVFTLPIGISSFVIRPSSSFLFAFLTTAAYTISSILAGYAWEYNLIAIIALFGLALITWAVANRLENTLKKNEALVSTLTRSNADIRNAYETTLEGWSHALEIRDHETEGHTLRVTDIVSRIAVQMGFKEEQLIHIRRGALLHDIGKLGIPDEILRKPGPLTEQEMKIMRTHPQIAYNLLYPIEYLRPALNIPHYHHEKWDGTGYPHGLKGNDIPLEARIFAIIDVYDALSHDRPYRKSWPKEKVLEYIKSESGKHFDPTILEVFIKEVEKDEN